MLGWRALHVLHVIDGLGLGGAERMLVDIANATVADGHRVSVCVTRADDTLARELDPRVELLVLRRRGRVDPAALVRLAAWLRRRKIDVVHAHMRSNLVFALALRAMNLVRAPIVFHDHYGTIETDNSIPPWFRVGRRWIAHYVGVYDRLCEWAGRAGVPAARTTTIPNALDLARLRGAAPVDLRAELGVAPDVPIGVMVGRLRRDKGVELLLEAVARSRHRGRMRVVLVGGDGEPDYTADCRRRFDDLGLADTITFLGPRTDVPGLLPSADFALLASHTESGPLVLIEYLAAGLPVVATRVGDIGRRLAAAGVPGFVEAGDVAAFAAELDALVALDRAQRHARGALGRRILDEGWDIRAAMPRWYEVYRAAMGRLPGALS